MMKEEDLTRIKEYLDKYSKPVYILITINRPKDKYDILRWLRGKASFWELIVYANEEKEWEWDYLPSEEDGALVIYLSKEDEEKARELWRKNPTQGIDYILDYWVDAFKLVEEIAEERELVYHPWYYWLGERHIYITPEAKDFLLTEK